MIIIASGSEVGLAYKVCEKLLEENICTRLVSMPCMEEFEKQSKEYKERVLPNNIAIMLLDGLDKCYRFFKDLYTVNIEDRKSVV